MGSANPDPDQYIAKKPFISYDFSGGGGGAGAPVPHLDLCMDTPNWCSIIS